MKFFIHNNLTRKKEEFIPSSPDKVLFYSCGPTTYDYLHVGNARALVVGDLMARALRTYGYQVKFVRNFTDVDDKIIERARELSVDALEHSARFIGECEQDMASLGLITPDVTPKVSTTMKEIIEVIEKIIAHGHAYVIEGEVFYDVKSYEAYGELSRRDLDDLAFGKRVGVDQRKKHPADFVLWKPAKEGEIAWESPWGKGRPGWHIECSAMIAKELGETIDLHHGGVDLIFPHHENERAQSEAAHQCCFCRYWAHNEFLMFAQDKMSKSLGNLITIRDFCHQHGGQVLRHLLLSFHYRSKIEWSDELVKNAQEQVKKIHQFVCEVEATSERGVKKFSPSSWIEQMKETLFHDFNAPGVIGLYFRLMKEARREKLVGVENQAAFAQIHQFLKESLGLIVENPQEYLNSLKKSGGSDHEHIEKLIAERTQARLNKDWARSDEIRDELQSLNVKIIDLPSGETTWEIF